MIKSMICIFRTHEKNLNLNDAMKRHEIHIRHSVAGSEEMYVLLSTKVAN